MRIEFIVSFLIVIILKQYMEHSKTKEMSLRSINKVVTAFEQAEGAGAIVKRSIGVGQVRRFNPFLLLDHFVGGDGGFPEHPHAGQETISLMLKGAMAHEDFTGSKGILYPGDLQFMTAGRGVVHSEMPVPLKDGAKAEGLQLWVDLPKDLKEVSPRYRDLKTWEIPEAESEDKKVRVRVISGKAYGIESVKELAYTPVDFYQVSLKSGGVYRQEVSPSFNFFMYVLKGKNLTVCDDAKVHSSNAVFFERDGDYVTVKNNSTDPEEVAEFVLVGGKVLDQASLHYGPIVANSSERIQQALQDYTYQWGPFERLKTWKTLISHGVTQDMIDNELGGSLEEREKQKKEYLAQHTKT